MSVPSFEFAPPAPLPLAPPPLGTGGGNTCLLVKGAGGANSNDWRESLALCNTLCPDPSTYPMYPSHYNLDYNRLNPTPIFIFFFNSYHSQFLVYSERVMQEDCVIPLIRTELKKFCAVLTENGVMINTKMAA